jgi:hypothetical protein
MHEFEFEVRISDQIQTVKMAVGRHLKFYLNIVSFRSAKISLEQVVSLFRFWTLFSIIKARTGTPGGVLDSDKKAPYG